MNKKYLYFSIAESSNTSEGQVSCNDISSSTGSNLCLSDIWDNLDVAKDLEGAGEEPPTPAERTNGDGNNIADENGEAGGGGQGDFGRRWERLVQVGRDQQHGNGDSVGDDTSPRGEPGDAEARGDKQGK